jgi:hypothetical protein
MTASSVTGKGPGSSEGQTKGADRQTLGYSHLIGPNNYPTDWQVEAVIQNRSGVDPSDSSEITVVSHISPKKEYMFGAAEFTAGVIANSVGDLSIAALKDINGLAASIAGFESGPGFRLLDTANTNIALKPNGLGAVFLCKINAGNHVYNDTYTLTSPTFTLSNSSYMKWDMATGLLVKKYITGIDAYFMVVSRQVWA